MRFFKRVLSTVTGIFVFLFICFLGLIILGFVFGSSSSQNAVSVKPNSVLELKLDFPIKDYAKKVEFSQYPFLNEYHRNGLFNIIRAIDYAASDKNIKGISIDNNKVNAGISQIKAIRKALLRFKSSGKFIVSYADVYSQKDYYLSSVADTMYLNPAGLLEFKGLSSEQLYFKDFQEQTGFKMEVIRHGKYKSAVEPFLANEMSANNREQISVYLNALWTEIKKDISITRNVSVEKLNTIADGLLARNAPLAKATKLIDRLGYHDQYISSIKQALGILDPKSELNSITISDYTANIINEASNSSNNTIALIYAEGDIVYGKGDPDNVGHLTINKALEEVRNNENIKAVVLRINSPGGSALASELIWREVALTKQVKPVVVSMGNLAASGGYYIAANANKIIAEPTTITGSIGVFGLLPNGKQLADDLGINAEQVVTNPYAVGYSFFEPLEEEKRKFIKEDILNVYNLFTKRVAEGRALTKEQVEAVAQGRVWIGTDAMQNGLVDELGGFDVALQYAAEAANIQDYKLREFPVYEKDLEKILEDFGFVKTKETLLKEALGEAHYKTLKDIKAFSKKKGVQLLFPFSTNIN